MVTLNQNVVTVPGVHVFENTAGLVPSSIAPFRSCYMLGTAAQGEYNTPVQVVSAEDFTNIFGSSTSLNAVTLFFRNHPYGILYFVRCQSPDIVELTVATPVAGAYSLSVSVTGLGSPQAISYTATSGDIASSDPLQAVIDGIITKINENANLAGKVLAFDPQPANGTFRIKALDPAATLSTSSETAPAGSTFTGAGVITTIKDDFVYACENAFDSDQHEQGFLIAPQAFQSLSSELDRQAVGVSMQNLCEQRDFNWMALADCHGSVVTTAQALREGKLYNPLKGHLAIYYPYVQMIDVGRETVEVPASPAVAAIGLRRYAEQGFQEPPAGILYPLSGVLGVAVQVHQSQHAVLNTDGNNVNVIRKLPNRGIVVYGARTRSSNEYYRFINTRVILNVIAGTFKRAFDQFVFSSIDGQGILFSRIKQTAEAVLFRLWRGRALYGATPAQAFLVVMDSRNNPELDLEAGIFRMDVYCVPVPTGERFLINLNRTAIGQIEIAASSLNV